MAHALGRIGNLIFGRYGTHGRFWTVALIGGISLEAFFVPATDDWFFLRHNAGRSYESVLPQILRQQANLAVEDDEEEEEEDDE
jgi:hypothetical protein